MPIRIICLSFCCLFAGCFKTVETITVTEYVAVEPPWELKTPCVPKPFPAPLEYANLSEDARENLLTEYILDLTKDLKICNDTIEFIFQNLEAKTKAIENGNE